MYLGGGDTLHLHFCANNLNVSVYTPLPKQTVTFQRFASSPKLPTSSVPSYVPRYLTFFIIFNLTIFAESIFQRPGGHPGGRADPVAGLLVDSPPSALPRSRSGSGGRVRVRRDGHVCQAGARKGR